MYVYIYSVYMDTNIWIYIEYTYFYIWLYKYTQKTTVTRNMPREMDLLD